MGSPTCTHFGDVELNEFDSCCIKSYILIWPFQTTISIAKNVFQKALAEAVRYRWSVEVILVYANDYKYARFGDHAHIRTTQKKDLL